jgi:23S rRNA pseudouridine2605 synthase
MPESVRLQKVLSERGVCSRRHAADWILAGRVAVNGQAVREPGARVVPGSDTIRVDGHDLDAVPPPRRTILLHKPAGTICSRAGEQGRTIYELDPAPPADAVPAGRLDKGSEGLLILSSDGDLVARLTHPRHGQRKTYRVWVSGAVDAPVLAALRGPMTLDGYPIRPVIVNIAGASARGIAQLEFVLREGRNRQIREMCRQVGLRVVRLVRTAVGSLHLDTLRLKPGQWRDATPAELAALTGSPTRRA